MKISGKTRGAFLATAATLLIISNAYSSTLTTPSGTSTKAIKCYGINSCRARGQCGSKTVNSCAGHNSCKGLGWLYIPSDQCFKKGGKKLDY